MKNLCILFVLALQLCSMHCEAQFQYTSEIDSLLKAFENESLGEEDRYDAVRKAIRGKYLMTDPDSSLILSKKYNKLSKQKKNTKAEASSLYFMGFSYFINGHEKAENDDSLAFELMRKSLVLHKEINNSHGIAEVYHGIGLMYSIRSTTHGITHYVDSTYKYYTKSVNLSLELKDSVNITKTYNQLARWYMYKKLDYNKAILIANEALEAVKKDGSDNTNKIQLDLLKAEAFFDLGLMEKSTDSFLDGYKTALRERNNFFLGHTMTRMNDIFRQSENHLKSIEILNEALDLVKVTQERWLEENVYAGLINAYIGLDSLETAEEYLELMCPNYSLLSYSNKCSICTGNIEIEKKNYKLARKHLKAALSDTETPVKTEIYNGLGRISQELKEFKSAESAYNSALTLSQEFGLFKEELDAQKGLYEVYKTLGKTAASLKAHEIYLDKKLEFEAAQNVASRASFEYKVDSEKRILADSLAYLADKSILATENKAQKKTIWLSLIGLAIITLLSLFLLQIYNKVRNQNGTISQALEEKDTLLKEIHHRVKNNLQVVSSLLRLQSNTTENEGALGALKESQSRVQSMSLIHQSLYQKDNLTGVQMKGYLEKLCGDLLQTYSLTEDKITLEMDVQDLNLDVDSVVPIGLIVNELITNAVKYAFPDNRSGTIWVNLKEENGKLHLMVKDNGVGIQSMDEMKETNSFGHRLINSFSRKLEADVSIKGDAGTEIKMIISEYEAAFSKK